MKLTGNRTIGELKHLEPHVMDGGPGIRDRSSQTGSLTDEKGPLLLGLLAPQRQRNPGELVAVIGEW